MLYGVGLNSEQIDMSVLINRAKGALGNMGPLLIAMLSRANINLLCKKHWK